jgi:hypothetical protein
MNRSDVRTILETSLDRPVKAFLEGLGFVVKGEVGGCDLVALKGDDLPVVVICELKLTFNLTASGEWVSDRTHGQQFRARFLKTSLPTSIEGIEKYLGSGMIRALDRAFLVRRIPGRDVFEHIS